ncbi:MAG: hypothetical protein CMD28_04660 [Flavobacteriales bacterium]|nr:hypothetical protein [Flavobacteriales bacterium]
MPRKIEKRNRESQFKYLFCLIALINIQSCKTYKITSANQNTPIKDFDIELVGDAPEYAKIEYWAEHTDKENHYAILPKNYTDTLYNYDPKIDVFFVHPTIYLKGDRWNADINDKELNEKIGKSAIKYQASVFLGIANIYAPHYRQMHIHGYSDLKNGYKAYDIAYFDVKNAFLYYWKNHNNSKKFILAGHSQGTNHSERLLNEVILRNDTMKNQLLIIYLPGMPIKKIYDEFPPCNSSEELNCFVSWRTLAEGYYPSDWSINDSISCVNPISWATDSIISKKKNHLGILFKNHKLQYPKSIAAYNYNNVVWIKPIKIPFASFYRMKNYHTADYNLFWLNIRDNLRYRLQKNGYR